MNTSKKHEQPSVIVWTNICLWFHFITTTFNLLVVSVKQNEDQLLHINLTFMELVNSSWNKGLYGDWRTSLIENSSIWNYSWNNISKIKMKSFWNEKERLVKWMNLSSWELSRWDNFFLPTPLLLLLFPSTSISALLHE